jgi:asparagine synthase (glutamine-hydrolysing)
MHPRLEPHFTSNEGYEHDYRWNDFFHLMGAAPAGFNTLYVFHGLLSDAAREGCDMLLLAEWGNLTFSDRGESGFVEYFLKGKWRQLWLALRRPPIHHGSIMRRVLACTFSAFLPDSLWRSFRKLLLRKNRLASELIQPLSPTYRRKSGANERLKASGRLIDRYQPWSRRHSRHMITESGDWISDAYQAFEQMYGIALRDPTAYRPFVEYCLGLPTHMFMRDGEIRWLAKQMAKGMMPEEQRKNSLGGWWDADWHLRIGRRREDFLAELDCLEDHDRLGEMLDISRLRSALNDWPERTETDPQKFFGIQLAIPAALLTARFVKYVEGKND